MANLIDLLQENDGDTGLKTFGRRFTERIQRKFLHRAAKASNGFLKECEFRPVQSAMEFERVAILIQNEVRSSKTDEQNLKARWFSLSQATDQNITFICLYKKKYLLGAISIVRDSALGIPSDAIYKSNINHFRKMGRALAEITALVLNNQALTNVGLTRTDRLILALKLMKSAVEYSKHVQDADTIVIRCNRRHEIIHKALLYRPLTGLEYYTGKDKQAYPAFFLDLDYLKLQHHMPGSRLWAINFLASTVSTAIQPYRFSFYALMKTFSSVKTAA